MPERQIVRSLTVVPSYKAYFELWAIGAILLYYAGLGLFVFLYIYLDRRFRQAVITLDHVTVSHGIISKKYNKIAIASIRKVFVKQNAVQKYFDVGGLKILTNDLETPQIEIKYILDPYGLKSVIARHHKKLVAAQSGAAETAES
jgi:membrane protein YdbS with pleckstrin-like domain